MTLRCASCENKDCRDGKDCFGRADRDKEIYKDECISRLHRAASAIEARFYCKEPRLREVILLARELECHKVGLAFCVGLESEAKIIADVLSQEFEVISVCCKVCGIAKSDFNLERISSDNSNEVICNPAGQAELLNESGTELNILCGLCVGHDAVFSMMSKAPVTTLIAKDRVLAHNPVGAIYSQYIRRKMLTDGESYQKEEVSVD
ncbi:MAG: DUF1847 domain-containing protein [Syntrophaceae bacterium]|nr:DUF1847 domain-containing protein [Syntrophaceae bacterium]